ncbi:MAG: DUF5071 domain-containing protein [Bacteroidota bacterium]
MMKPFIPTHKDDFDALSLLEEASWEEIQPHIKAILEWLQDMNWPIAHRVAKVMYPHVNHFQEELVDILLSKDDIWKYGCLSYLLEGNPNFKPDSNLLRELYRIRNQPTKGEEVEELHEIANSILSSLGLENSH